MQLRTEVEILYNVGMTNWIDLLIIGLYLVGTTLFGCSFFFRKKGGDVANTFMTGGGSCSWARRRLRRRSGARSC